MKVTYTELEEKAKQGYGVTRWADPQSIRDSLKELTDKNIYGIPKDVYENDIRLNCFYKNLFLRPI